VAEGSPSEWLTCALVDPVDQRAIAESGAMVRAEVLTAVPEAVAEPPDPVPPVPAAAVTVPGGAGGQIDVGQGIGRTVELARRFHHHMVLVQPRIDVRHLPLAEGVIERGIDGLHQDAQPRGGIAVHFDEGVGAGILLVDIDIGD